MGSVNRLWCCTFILLLVVPNTTCSTGYQGTGYYGTGYYGTGYYGTGYYGTGYQGTGYQGTGYGSTAPTPLFACTTSIGCTNGGTCTFGSCVCVAGFTGSTCDLELDECISGPCQNNGTCVDLINRVMCICKSGYTGDDCGNSTKIGVQPTVGPRSGGTLVTITGPFTNNTDLVTIGDIPCLLTERNADNYVCLSGPLVDATKVNKSLDVILYNNNTGTSRHSIHQFKYGVDPVIFKVEPLKSIESGGALLTVTGQNLDIVETRVMVTTVRSVITLMEYTTETNCTVESSSEMVCLTPEINVGRLSRRRKRRQSTTSLNVRENIEVEISFRLDGVQEYRNLTGTSLHEYSRITVYIDPVIQRFSPSVLTFTPTWPVEEQYLEIKGDSLLQGLIPEAYLVRVGEAVCANIDVQDNVITCKPPKTRPQVSTGDYVGDNRIPVKLIFASQAALLGHLEYIQNLWEYPPARHGIIGALFGIVFVIIIIIIACWSRRPPTHNELASRGLPVRSQGLVQRVKRWSRKSPKRFSSFIPTGNRLPTTSYANSTYKSDIRSNSDESYEIPIQCYTI